MQVVHATTRSMEEVVTRRDINSSQGRSAQECCASARSVNGMSFNHDACTTSKLALPAIVL